MRAWTILMFLVLFNISFIVVGALGIWTTPEGHNPLALSGSDFVNNFTEFPPDYMAILSSVTIGLAVIGSVFLRMPVGAAVYAGLMGVNLFSLDTIFGELSGYGFTIMPEMQIIITAGLSLMFLWGFIDLAS